MTRYRLSAVITIFLLIITVHPAGSQCPDTDNDTVCDSNDNCPWHVNPDQQDSNNDGIGDACQIAQGSIRLDLELIADNLHAPQIVVTPGDGTKRMFIVEQNGTIRILQDDTLLRTPFLDLSDKLVNLNSGYDERGLLGLAFHPDYATNGRFFVRYSAPRQGDPSEPCARRQCHKEVLAEYKVSDDPYVADPSSERIIYEADQPQSNHNGGHVAFGPDGYLYFILGDGGGAGDGLASNPPSHGPEGNGQNIQTALGTLLRIDINSGTPYAIPPDNPFVGKPGLDEIYAYGLRNAFRFSFDRGGSRTMVIPDVGQNLFEEVNIGTRGGNYGWAVREGAHCFDPHNQNTPLPSCDTTGLIDPIAEYTHDDGLAVIGGHIYRGTARPDLHGIYIFGDFSQNFGPTGRLFYIDMNNDRTTIYEVQLPEKYFPLNRYVYGFGEDDQGELYLLTTTSLNPNAPTGELFRIK